MRKSLLAVPALALVLATGCGATARQDATTSGQHVDSTAAEVIAFPDQFRNVAHKCDGHGHRVYSNSTGDSGSSAELYVIADPTCR